MFLTLDSFQKDPICEMDTFHFKGKWRGSGSAHLTSHMTREDGKGVKILQRKIERIMTEERIKGRRRLSSLLLKRQYIYSVHCVSFIFILHVALHHWC